MSMSDFVAMPFRVVLVGFAVFLVPGSLMRAVAERLVLGESAHANPDGFLLGLDLQRSLIRFNNSPHRRTLPRQKILSYSTAELTNLITRGVIF